MSETVVITGASSGIGRAIVRRFARDKARIALLARGREGLDGARREVEEAGGRALLLPTDVADADAVEAAAQATEEALGPIGIWVNDAMATILAPAWEISAEEYRRITEVSYLGTVYGTLAALKRMRERDAGTIVQVGSAMAYRGIPLQAPYCGAKHAIKGFVESVRCDLRHEGSKVHVTMVQLPGVNTPQFDHARTRMPNHPMPVPPIYQPEVAADAVHWAAHHRRRELYVGIPAVYTIFGSKLAPWLAERYLARTAVKSQQTDEPVRPDRPDNLFGPPPGDEGAHGDFDDKAHAHSVQLLATKHRRGLAVTGVAAAAAAAALAARDGQFLRG